jgi:predicted dehydrogenase
MLNREKRKSAGRSTVRLAIIGCGAVTELCHLPAAKLTQEVKIVALVDKNIQRAKLLAKRFGITNYAQDYQQLPENVNGVIIALTNFLHAPVAMDFLKSRMPVLIEKPMALTVEEAEAMVKTADVAEVALQVGLMYRFCNGARLVKRVIDEGWLGALQSFSLESGFVYDWPVTTGFIFSKEQAGGGVLIDTGSHMLDLLRWWLGDVIDVEYRDDSLGGVEADCLVSLVLQHPTGPVQGTVTLSRIRKLSDTARIVGERFTIEYDLSTPQKVRIWPSTWHGKCTSFISDFGPTSSQSWNEVYAEQLRAFAQAIFTGGKSAVPGESVISNVALIERCYRGRQPLELP